jgi:hypothetical protein
MLQNVALCSLCFVGGRMIRLVNRNVSIKHPAANKEVVFRAIRVGIVPVDI